MASLEIESKANTSLQFDGESNFVTVVTVQDDESESKKTGASSLPENEICNGVLLQKDMTAPLPVPRHFVTVVSVESEGSVHVDSDSTIVNTSTFVRVDVPGSTKSTENFIDNGLKIPQEAIVYRLPGERLGFGLKFDGGMGSTEKIKRLYIQSIAPDSPAARAQVPWGQFDPGDEILHIEGTPVAAMTRVECVTQLKEASVKLTLGVLKGNGVVPATEESYLKKGNVKKRPAPPPLPVRLQNRRIPARPPKEGINLPPPEGFEDNDFENSVSRRNKTYDKDLVETFNGLPPAAAVYLDLLSEEEKGSQLMYESESDETNSSASTVVDKLSLSSSSRTVSRNSSFNTTMDLGQFDLARAVSPFEHLEEEFNILDNRQLSTSAPLIDGEEISEGGSIVRAVSDYIKDIDFQNETSSESYSSNENKRAFEESECLGEYSSESEQIFNFSSTPKRPSKRAAPQPPENGPVSPISSDMNKNTDFFDKINSTIDEGKEVENYITRKAPENIYSEGTPEWYVSPMLSNFTANNGMYGKSEFKPNQYKLEVLTEENDFFNDDDDTESDYSFYEKPLEVDDTNGMIYHSLDSNAEPIDANSYMKDSSYFVDHVSNPAYGLPNFSKLKDQEFIDENDIPDHTYEEVDPSSGECQILVKEIEVDSNVISNAILTSEFHSKENDISNINELTMKDATNESQVESNKVVFPSLENIPTTFSRLSRDSKIRKDISNALKEDLDLKEGDEVQVEEIEEVESRIECETEEEVLLVLRALRSDNSFYLDDSHNEALKITAPRSPVLNTKKQNRMKKINHIEEKSNIKIIGNDSDKDYSAKKGVTTAAQITDCDLPDEILKIDNDIIDEDFQLGTEPRLTPDSGQQSLGSEPLSSIPEEQVLPTNSVYENHPLITIESYDNNDASSNEETKFILNDEFSYENVCSKDLHVVPKIVEENLFEIPSQDDKLEDAFEDNQEKQSSSSTIESDDGEIVDATEVTTDFSSTCGENENLSVSLYEQRCSSLTAQDSPPSYSRLPPDGHEFPSNYTEGLQDKINRFKRYSYMQQDMDFEANSGLCSSQGGNPATLPRVPSSTKSNSPSLEMRSVSRWRRQDERSERSVKDKIAMFSSEKEPQDKRKLNRSESIGSVSSEKSSSKTSFTDDSLTGSTKKDESIDKTCKRNFSSMINVHSSDFDSRENTKPSPTESTKSMSLEEKPESVKTLPSGLNIRSQSLLDIGRNSPSRVKRHSVGAYDRPFVYKCGIEKPEEHERRTSLNNMIEQRRKSLSKLRGLIIPETRTGDEVELRIPLDLPKISSHAPSIKSMSLTKSEIHAPKVTNTDNSSGKIIGNNLRYKESPTENRRNSISNLPPNGLKSSDSFSSSTPRKRSPQRSFDGHSNRRSDSFESDEKYSNFGKSPSPKLIPRKQGFYDGRSNRSTEDSDNDSAVSTQSSFSQGLSPRDSPMPDVSDQEDSISYQSGRYRHSSQSSFDEIDGKRILKTGSIEAKNRRNIIKSAKCSSGKSSDEQSTPEIVRKHPEITSENSILSRKLETDIKVSPKKRTLQREPSCDSTSSTSSKPSKESISRRNSKDSIINTRDSDLPLAEPIYIDKKNNIFKESQIKVAYMNEITDNFEEANSPGEIIAEVHLQSKPLIPEVQKEKVTVFKDEKWSTLQQKYAENSLSGIASKKTNFEAVASKWKQRTEEDPRPRHPQLHVKRRENSKLESAKEISSLQKYKYSKDVTQRSDFQQKLQNNSFVGRPTSLDVPRAEVSDRKYSVPEYGVKYREKKEGGSGEISSRPTSLIEGSSDLSCLHQESQYITSLNSSMSTDSHDDLLDSSDSSLSRAGSKEVLDAFTKPQINSVSPKMSDIMRAFERHDLSGRKCLPTLSTSHPRMSSLDSTTSDDGFQAHYGSISSLASGQRDQYGSITSLSSSTSIISPQELAQLIEDANHSLEESGTPSHEILVVVLHREVVGYGSIGITLAGGSDYDTKEVTVHKVIPGSLADRDGRIQKGDRVISINGKPLRGVTHREALNILKSPRPEVVLVLSRSRSVTPQETTLTHSNSGDFESIFSHRQVFINNIPPPRPPKILESPLDSKSLVSDIPYDGVPRGPPQTITLVKEGAGVGFSLEGGKDSPLGDRPLSIKKIFSGGAADKGGILRVGDELVNVNSVDLTNMARIEAWNFLKKLPDGTVTLIIKQKLKDREDGSAID